MRSPKLKFTFALFLVVAGSYGTRSSAVDTSPAEQTIKASLATDSVESSGQVVVVYFTPRDRKPAKNHTARIRRITETTADFYEQELKRHGFTDRKMNVLREASGAVRIIDVVGKDLDRDYGKPDGDKIRAEILPVLRENGIDPRSSVLLMFCNLMDYDPVKSTIAHHSPYYGGGTHQFGNAWQCDSEILDPLRFTDKTRIRDGEYGRITIGRHNSIFIGGVVHELGHALSLPHCRQRSDEAARGTALMGSGNRTFRQELRGEGKGTFLTLAHALRLAAHPAFNTRSPAKQRAHFEWSRLKVMPAGVGKIAVSGAVESAIPVHGIVAYFDPAGGGDYDATSATSMLNESGEFELESDQLPKGRLGELRLVACRVDGSTASRRMPYKVGDDAAVDLSSVRLELELQAVVAHLRVQKTERARETLERVAQDDPELKKIGTTLIARFERAAAAGRPASQDATKTDAAVKQLSLSKVKPTSASVGWIQPTYDRIPSRDVLLSIDGDLFAEGIYAHAPAEHRYSLGGKWKRLSGGCGMQSGHRGRVKFEIHADGKRIWTSPPVADGSSAAFSISIADAKELKLIVNDGGNGTSSDWGVWIQPRLER